MKIFKRFMALLLCAMMILGAVSCGTPDEEAQTSQSPDAEDTDGTVVEGTDGDEDVIKYVLDLTLNGKTEFDVVYPRLSEENVLISAEKIADKIKEYTGATVKVHDDSQKAEYEILVGMTERAESVEVSDTLRANDYKIQVFEKKLVICGGNAESLAKATTKFLDKIVYARGKKGSTDRSVQISSADDFYFAYNYPVKPGFTLAGKSLKEYTIIYDNSSVYAEYSAHVLKRMLLEKAGYNLELYADNDVEVENEILMGMTERTQGSVAKNTFAIEMQGSKLCAKFDGLLAQEQTIDFMKSDLFGGKTDSVAADYSKTVDLEKTITGSERSIFGNTGDIRIITSNIYQAADFYVERMRLLNMVYSEYAPDVILLQEASMVSWTKSETKNIHALLAAKGYETILANAGAVRAEHEDIGNDGTDDRNNATPIVYNKNTLELLDSGYFVYTLENNGHSKSYTWAHFKVKATGKTFIAFSTHMMWTPDATKEAHYEAIRVQNSKELVTKIKSLVEEYGCPAFGGGDINGYITSEHCQYIMDQGFSHVRDIAEVQDKHIGTCSPMNPPDTETGFFFEDLDESSVKGEIDLLFAYGDASDYKIMVHDILIHDFAISGSDHAPVLIDVKLN